MQPSAYPVNQKVLLHIWQTFVRTGKITRDQEAILDPVILLSWRRCLARLNPHATPRLAPLHGDALASRLRTHAELVTISEPVIEDTHQFIENSGCAVLLADSSACILDHVGDETAVQMIKDLGIGRGSYWSEGQMGTNAFGTAILNAMPTLVVGAEHYHAVYHQIFSSAAPVHDIRGRIVGAVGIVGPLNAASPHTLALAMSAARAVSTQFQANWSLQEANQRMAELNAILSTISEGVIAWDVNGAVMHVNRQAGNLLAINPITAPGHPIKEVLALPEVVTTAVAKGEELRDKEATFAISGRTVRALLSMRLIREPGGSPSGYITLIRPMEQVRRLVQQQAGALATLTIDDVYGQTPVMRRVLRQARIAARGTAPVLLRGEGGVGKNHLAQAIHNESERANKPFVAINCRAIPHELMVGELLGEELGTTIRPSKFELADGGTLLLDQVESLSLEMQVAVLQLIETGHISHLGGVNPIPLDVRIIVASTEDLERLVAEGSFLSHLYYRFGVFSITIPPLRQRTDDLPLLAERFLARITRRDSRAMWIDDEAMSALRRYPWPGNVRELESILERAVHQSHDGVIRATTLPASLRQRKVLTGHTTIPEPVISVTEAEREAIIRAGWACHGRVAEMAQELQIGRTTLWRKMKRYNITPNQFK